MNIVPFLSYLIYDGFDRDLATAMVYERLMESIETSDVHYHALTFLHSCLIVKWRLNDAKPLLPQSQFFGMLPPDARQWAHSQFIQILPTQHMVLAGHQGPSPTGPQQQPTIHQQIPPPHSNTSVILVYQLDPLVIQEILTQATSISLGDTQVSAH